ncbi:MAG: hypothetical protein HYY51_02370 [Candidatus Magasanikbacteria bacterium]|nr:hypothetical protein [Candidatus Magasanikbacteria bacterium]
MKRILFFLVISPLLMSSVLVSSVSAIDLGNNIVKDAGKKAGYGETTDTTFAEMVGTVIKAVLSLVGIMFTFLLAYAGDMWMAARGEQDQIDKAKKIITGSIMGLIVTLGAYTLSNFAVNAILERATSGG